MGAEIKIKIYKHFSSMTTLQRKILIEIMERYHDLKKLALLTDPELHELWLVECEYSNPYKE